MSRSWTFLTAVTACLAARAAGVPLFAGQGAASMAAAALGLRGLGGTAADAPSCCAGYLDGSYNANMLYLVNAYGHGCATVGSIAFDAKNEQYIVFLGAYEDVEKSKFGAYVWKEDDTVKATVWGPKKCKTFNLPSCISDAPTMCFGPDSPLDRQLDAWDFDGYTSITAYGDSNGTMAALVSKRTCMPFAIAKKYEHHKKGGDSDADVRPARGLAAALGGGADGTTGLAFEVLAGELGLNVGNEHATLLGAEGHGLRPTDYGSALKHPRGAIYTATVFQNGTAKAPPAKCFSLPSWCSE